MSNIITPENVSNIKNESIFCDANILIYLYGITFDEDYSDVYSKILKKLLKNNNSLYIDYTVISEYINRCHRIDYKTHKQKIKNHNLKYKDYRNSQQGQDSMKDIYSVTNNIIENFYNIVGKEYKLEDIKSFIKKADEDFSDKAIINLCDEKSFYLLTNDIDFKNSGLNIISANENYFIN